MRTFKTILTVLCAVIVAGCADKKKNVAVRNRAFFMVLG